MKNLKIGISGINATDNPGPGVAVARSLKEAFPEITLIGLSYDVHDPGNYMSDIFHNSYLMPYPTKGWDGINDAILEIKNKQGLDGIISCLDAEIPLMMKHRKYLEEIGVKTYLPSQEQFELRNKDKLTSLSKEIKCFHPKTEVVTSIDQLVDVLRTKISLPAMVKGKYYKAYMVYNIETAILKGSEIAAEWGFPLLIQEVVQGQEINLIGLSDKNGDAVGHVSIKKQLTTHLGKVWTAVTIRDQSLDDLCKRFCKVTKWQGAFELECIINNEGIYLIEINPRFPAWVYFATGVGVNLPEMMVNLMFGEKVIPKFDYPLGKYLVRYSSEFVTDLTDFQNLLSNNNRKGL
jgi:carbamoyl-phosphate synthase large subunit